MADESLLDASIAQAMNRVLEAERAAQVAVHECRSECEKALDAARGERLAILERASARALALRARVTAALEEIAAKASVPAGPPIEAGGPAAERAQARAALERLAAQLAGASPGRADGPRG